MSASRGRALDNKTKSSEERTMYVQGYKFETKKKNRRSPKLFL